MEKQLLVTCVRNPFDPHGSRAWKWVDWHEGWSPKNYAAAAFFPLAPRDFEIAVSCNGALIPKPEIDSFRPAPGDNVVFCLVLHGGGKNVASTVAMIAVMVTAAAVTAGVGSAIIAGAGWGTVITTTAGSMVATVSLSTAGMMAAAAAGMAVAVAGAMLVNAVLPTAAPNVPGLDPLSGNMGGFDSSPTYAWSVESNSTKNGSPLPVLYGTRRITPFLAGRYVSLDGSDQLLNMLFVLGEGRIDAASDVWINENPSTNYDNVTLDKRYGTPGQTVISYFNDTISEQAVGYKLETGGWDTFMVSGDSLKGIGIGISLPGGLYYAANNGSLTEMVAEIDVQYRKDGGDWQTFTGSPFTIQDNKRQAIRKFWSMRGLAEGGYEIRARLHAAAHKPGQTGNPSGPTSRWMADTYFEYVQGIVPDDFRYPGVAMLGVRALATDQLSGPMPRVSCRVSRNTVPVWTGAAYENKPATNPAWICYDILHNGAPGHPDGSSYGGAVPYSRIVYADFLEWAEWCDSKGLECHIYFDSSQSLAAALSRAGEIGRGQVIQRGTDFSCIVDKLSSPVQLFTIGNIVEDSFQEAFLEQKDRANVIEISYFDADRDYTRQVIEVRRADYDYETTEIRRTAISLFGCVSKQQAVSHGKFLLNCNQYLTRTVTFGAAVDAIAIQPGDVFRFQHDVPLWGYGGRVVAATVNTVQLDREVTLEAGTTYRAGIRHNDDSFEIQTVTNAPGTTDTLHVASWTATPAKFELFCFGPVNSEYKLFRTLSVSRGPEQNCTITALEYHAEVYADTGEAPEDEGRSLLADVRGLAVREIWTVDKDGTVVSIADLSWRGEALAWSVYYRKSGGAWVLSASNLISPGHQIVGLTRGTTYDFSVTTGSADEGVLSTLTILGKDAAPSDVENFVASQKGTKVEFMWDHVPDDDVFGYEIRLATAGNDWEAATPIRTWVQENRASWEPDIDGTYRFLIKAIDTTGNYSANVASFDLTTDFESSLNVVAQHDEVDDGAPGTKEALVYVPGPPKILSLIQALTDNDLAAHTDTEIYGQTDTDRTGVYTSEVKDIGRVETFTFRLGVEFDSALGDLSDCHIADRTDNTYPLDTDNSITTDPELTIEYNTSANGSDWNGWVEYSGPVQLTCRHYKFRISCSVITNATSFEFTKLEYLVEKAAQDFEALNVAIDAAGTTFVFGSGVLDGVFVYDHFFVSATILGGVAKYPSITKNGLTDFKVDLFDNNGNSVAGDTDLRVWGF